jgi:hypothetical protein
MIEDPRGGIDYDEQGTGPTILFVPGSWSTRSAWRGIIALLADRFCIMTLRPGSSRNSSSPRCVRASSRCDNSMAGTADGARRARHPPKVPLAARASAEAGVPRSEMLRSTPPRPVNRSSPGFLFAIPRCLSMASRVRSLNSNLTGRPVFLCRTVARMVDRIAVRCNVLEP